jgi:hypothetical protein
MNTLTLPSIQQGPHLHLLLYLLLRCLTILQGHFRRVARLLSGHYPTMLGLPISRYHLQYFVAVSFYLPIGLMLLLVG